MNVLQLTEEENNKLINIHKEVFPKRKEKFSAKSFTNGDKNNIINTEYILDKTKNILNNLGIKNYNINRNYIEFQQRNCGFENSKFRTLNWHKDDKTVTSYSVYTIIYYLRKDKTIIGGNLEYRLRGEDKQKQKIEPGTILVFKGDIMHRPEICYGFGCRDNIVVFIKRNINIFGFDNNKHT